MKLKRLTVALSMAVLASPAFAGDFTTLLNTGAGQAGSTNPNSDRYYIEAADVTYADVEVPSSIDYNALATTGGIPRAVTATGTLTLLDQRVTENFVVNGDEIGNLYDLVFRDSRDNKLVFGTRILLNVEGANQVPDWELNFVYRRGFKEGDTTFETAAAWTFLSDIDLRMYNAARTSSESTTAAISFDPNTVRMQSDLNSGSENNPYSGLFLIKTNAQYYKTGEDAVGVFQMGEEGQLRVGGDYVGFMPTNTAPVPEPSTYAMLIGGLGLLGAMARRRRNA